MVAVQIFFIECLPYILKISKEAHRRGAPHTPPPMFMNLFLERIATLRATKPYVPPRLSKPILNVLPMYRYIFQGNNFPKQYYALNTICKLFRYKNFKKIIENQL